ncbi:MAG: 23S rRNA (pseudouridine(1915)-N(3))-methyltransferase RlmH [Methanomicrobiales archaeon]|nr:23S rRNA (pseudouridine(1915)-N(3))-methyltransferase RlmH [Methanomicrobiales archaeon]
MQITIVAVGKVRESFVEEGLNMYRSRLAPYHSLSFVNLPEERIPARISPKQKAAIMEAEWCRFPGTGPRPAVTVALDPGGVVLSSEEFASRMKRYELEGRGSVAFLIGGPLGLPDTVRERADFVLSLSPMTFPHQLVRLILIEQIYRAACINRNIPYHK